MMSAAEVKVAPPEVQKDEPHRDFSRRLQQACANNPNVPQPQFGRLQWIADQLHDRFNISARAETTRKWLAGEALPRHKTMRALAEIMQVDEAWLAFGKVPDVADHRAQKLRDAQVQGVVNVVAGFVQMHGANPAFPDDSDQRARKEHIDLYAIIRGAQYAFHVALALEQRDGWKFNIPAAAEDSFILGVVPIGDMAIEMIEIDSQALSEGTRRGGFVELVINKHYETESGRGLKRVMNFRERL